jgi:hypothetical protein
MLRDGAKQLVLLRNLGCKWFVVSYDADGTDWEPRRDEILARVVKPAGVEPCCVVVPVQEIEAWILADIECATKVFSGWRPDPIQYPENIADPKEYLERLSRDAKKRPRYSHATHNPRIAEHLDLDKVAQKCRSFRPLSDFMSHN